ncbi:asparagine synthase (glutamine-hydrolyzing) [bacterium]|nr:asparagine synthase (glutamine-hydrolyzing) [bacterium]
MCGIFGLLRPTGLTLQDEATFESLSSQLKHRGPDGSGFIETRIGLIGMHRLSIMDVEHGSQPFWSEDRQIAIVGNGEIYNAPELVRDLKRRGHQLNTGSDMEVIPHLYEEFGLDFPNKLRGMFALTIVDFSRNRLILVRDRLGEKPISYTSDGSQFIFASEQGALIRSGVTSRSLDSERLFDYLLHGFSPEPHSVIKGVSKVPAGSLLILDLSSLEVSIQRYWSLTEHLNNLVPTPEMLLVEIEDAISVTTQSDVPLGVALSGGIDSSLVATFAAKVRPDIHAFSIGYNGTKTDESTLARKYAEELGLSFSAMQLDSTAIGESFADLCSARDEPISDIAGPALSAVAKLARDHGVPVLLNGIGGDEWFWGYDWVRRLAAFSYGLASHHASVPKRYSLLSPLPTKSASGVAQWLETYGGFRTERGVRTYTSKWSDGDQIPISLYQFQPGYPRINASIQKLMGKSVLDAVPEQFAPNSPDEIPGFFMSALADTYLRVNSLAQTDRLGMQHSVEMRTPLVDYKLAEYIMSTRMHEDGFVGSFPKTELAQAAFKVLPNQILDRPKKGFVPPVRDWINSIWRHNQSTILNPERLLLTGLLNPDALLSEIRHPIQRSGRVNQMALRLATLEFWLRGFEE